LGLRPHIYNVAIIGSLVNVVLPINLVHAAYKYLSDLVASNLNTIRFTFLSKWRSVLHI